MRIHWPNSCGKQQKLPSNIAVYTFNASEKPFSRNGCLISSWLIKQNSFAGDTNKQILFAQGYNRISLEKYEGKKPTKRLQRILKRVASILDSMFNVYVIVVVLRILGKKIKPRKYRGTLETTTMSPMNMRKYTRRAQSFTSNKCILQRY